PAPTATVVAPQPLPFPTRSRLLAGGRSLTLVDVDRRVAGPVAVPAVPPRSEVTSLVGRPGGQVVLISPVGSAGKVAGAGTARLPRPPDRPAPRPRRRGRRRRRLGQRARGLGGGDRAGRPGRDHRQHPPRRPAVARRAPAPAARADRRRRVAVQRPGRPAART